MSSDSTQSMGQIFPDLNGPESPVISGVAHDRSEAMVTIRDIADKPGVATSVFALLAEGGVNIDMIVQAVAARSDGSAVADISITLPENQLRQAEDLLTEKQKTLGYKSLDLSGRQRREQQQHNNHDLLIIPCTSCHKKVKKLYLATSSALLYRRQGFFLDHRCTASGHKRLCTC